MTAVAVALAALLGLPAGLAVGRAAERWVRRPAMAGSLPAPPAPRDRAVPAVATALLLGLTAYWLGLSWELPAFLVLGPVAVLLAIVDLRCRLLPDRIVLPALGIGAVLLALAAAAEGEWAHLGRAVAGAAVLFSAYLVLALIAPSGLGMGDVKLAALLGLYLGWLGWTVLVTGAVAGFVVQAAVAVVLLATRRIGLRGELPFGPAMLLGAALAMALTSAA